MVGGDYRSAPPRHNRDRVPASANSTALRVKASPSLASSRAARLTWSRQPRGRPAGLPERPLANRPRRSRTPVPPVLSGRDQASPTPFNNFAPARGPLDTYYSNCVVVDVINRRQHNRRHPGCIASRCQLVRMSAQRTLLLRYCQSRGVERGRGSPGRASRLSDSRNSVVCGTWPSIALALLGVALGGLTLGAIRRRHRWV